MKKVKITILAIAMVFSLSIGQAVFAAEITNPIESTVDSLNGETEIQPHGSLSGSNAGAWPSVVGNQQNFISGSFTVDVTGTPWSTANTEFKLITENPNAWAQATLYYPDGTKAWDVNSWLKDYLASGKSVKKTISPGSVGTYRVEYSVWTSDRQPLGGGFVACIID